MDLEDKINPYNLTLNNFTKKERKNWFDKVYNQLKIKNIKESNLVIFAGNRYCEFFEKAEKPLDGLTLGQSIKWINNKNKKGWFK